MPTEPTRKTASERKVTPMRTPPDVHAWFGLSYANYLVLPRSVLQSMPDEWQRRFTSLMDEMNDAFGHLDWPRYDVRALAREQEHIDSEDCATCDGTGEVLEGGLPVDSEHGCPDCGGRGLVDADRWETPEDVGIIADPIPHYDRGRTKLTPAESEAA